MDRGNKEKEPWNKTLIIGGICCGLALCAAGNVQQIGLYYTSVSHTGFITALYEERISSSLISEGEITWNGWENITTSSVKPCSLAQTGSHSR